jgi:ABC-type multidrug transport system ATPase subunit
MKITLSDIGKRYNYEWIFRKVNYEFTSGDNYVLLGSNGSGKSTLLQVIAGNLIPSEGGIKYQLASVEYQDANAEKSNVDNANIVDEENIYRHISYAAPYLDLFEEFTLIESIEFQSQFKPFYEGFSVKDIMEITQLEKAKNKQLKYFSSGMKQRVRLALAVLCDSPLLLLDEPTSNLDKKAIDWYQQLVTDHSKNRLIIVASNQQEYEYPFCNKTLMVEDYK